MLLVKVGVLVVRNAACTIVVTACVHFIVSTVASGDVNCLHNYGEMCNQWHFCDIFKQENDLRTTVHMHKLAR